ncbi:MAG: threonine synthase, partial [Clostridia bacterium]|nr:threonine synthase [Clostridia bacterium]
MMYLSTRGGEVRCTSAEAIKNGLAGNGGLFVPETIPSLSEDGLKRIASLGYAGRAAEIMSL